MCTITNYEDYSNIVYTGPPLITVNPTGGNIPLGTNVVLQCEASGKGSLVYSWVSMQTGRGWTVIDNSNTTTYTTSVTGLYRCNVRNEAGSVVSTAAAVEVYGMYSICAMYMYININIQVYLPSTHIPPVS